jgi:hypothetical protein
MENYERQQAIMELYKKLGEAESNLANNRKLLDGEDVFRELRKKYVK